jgi:hypothetical protein
MKESILSRISALLGMDKVELASMKLMDGVTVLEADAFEPGMEVFIVTQDEQRIALPVGEYELEDGKYLVITQEGIIAEIKEAPVDEAPTAPEAPMMNEEVATEPTLSEETASQPKKIIKSQVEEMLFSKIEELKAENEALKLQLSEQPKVEEAPVIDEPASKPISHNPEKQNPTTQFSWGGNRKESTMDRILNKLS